MMNNGERWRPSATTDEDNIEVVAQWRCQWCRPLLNLEAAGRARGNKVVVLNKSLERIELFIWTLTEFQTESEMWKLHYRWDITITANAMSHLLYQYNSHN